MRIAPPLKCPPQKGTLSGDLNYAKFAMALAKANGSLFALRSKEDQTDKKKNKQTGNDFEETTGSGSSSSLSGDGGFLRWGFRKKRLVRLFKPAALPVKIEAEIEGDGFKN